jgi:predicted metallopeptidase
MGFLGLDFLTLHNIVVVRSKISRESKARVYRSVLLVDLPFCYGVKYLGG